MKHCIPVYTFLSRPQCDNSAFKHTSVTYNTVRNNLNARRTVIETAIAVTRKLLYNYLSHFSNSTFFNLIKVAELNEIINCSMLIAEIALNKLIIRPNFLNSKNNFH